MTDGFEDFLLERRERADRTQRRLIGGLAVTCIALTIFNVLLALWIASGPARPPESATRSSRESRPVQSAEAPPSASVPSASESLSSPPAEPRARAEAR